MARFVYYNNNPFGYEEDDCVTRAIALSTGESYRIIRKKLVLSAELLECEELCVCCYNNVIENVYDGEPVFCDGMTVNEFADLHPYGIFLLRMEGHITCLIDNCIFDLWDCRDKEITDAWCMN